MTIEQVAQRLNSLGYIVQDTDQCAVSFCMQKVENHIKNTCNLACIPDGLHQIAIDMVCAEFLTAMKQIGRLDDVFTLETAVKSVQAGDTTVSFDTATTAESRLDALLAYLARGEGELLCYRKIRW